MFSTYRQRVIVMSVGLVILGCVLAVIIGCDAMRQFDYQLAEAIKPPPRPVTTQPGQPVTQPTEPPPPLVEIGAGILALFGYGGLAAYIRSTKRNGTAAIEVLLARIVELEKRQTPA